MGNVNNRSENIIQTTIAFLLGCPNFINQYDEGRLQNGAGHCTTMGWSDCPCIITAMILISRQILHPLKHQTNLRTLFTMHGKINGLYGDKGFRKLYILQLFVYLSTFLQESKALIYICNCQQFSTIYNWKYSSFQ